jgi:acyl-CoA thioesterase
MVNGHDICHGGFIFALADSAFAYACNTFNVRTVASAVDINFIAPAHKSARPSRRTAEARHQGGRSGVYDIEVKNDRTAR